MVKVVFYKNSLDKKPIYLTYFLFYFFFITFQFAVSFFSKEVSYDRNYYYGNYILLILFSTLVYLNLKSLNDIKYGLIIISIFFIIITFWCIVEFYNARIASTIAQLYPNAVINDLTVSQKRTLLNEAVSKHGYVSFKNVFKNFRPSLSFGNVNYFAGFIIGLMPLLFVSPIILYDKQKPFYKNYLSISMILVSLASIIPLIFTQTRAAQVGWLFGCFFILFFCLFLMTIRTPFIIKTIIGVSIVLLIVILSFITIKNINSIPLIQKFFPRISDTMTNINFQLKDRINGWEGGLGLFKKHPLTGAGLGTVYAASFKYTNKYFLIYSASNSFKHSHSEYVEVLGEGGILGLIFFISLFGFVITALVIQAFSKKYDYKFRVLSIATASGIISMLLLQIFCLSLRMSVTMSAYFFLIGLGIFLISYKNNAFLEGQTKKSKEKALKKGSFMNKQLNRNGLLFITFIIAVLIITGFILFIRLFKCEYNIVKFIDTKNKLLKDGDYKRFDEPQKFLDNAIRIMPENVYAWNEKWQMDFYIFLQNSQDESNVEKYFASTENDLDSINRIIPGYQEIYSKYAHLYVQKIVYYSQRYDYYKNPDDLLKMDEVKKTAFDYLNKALDMNFLDLNNHINRLILLNSYNDRKHYEDYLKDYINAKIYIDFCKSRRIIKENLEINYGENDNLIQKNNKYYFTISNSDIKMIADNIFSYKDFNSFGDLQYALNDMTDKILQRLYLKVNKT
jgi:O-antigen ligase